MILTINTQSASADVASAEGEASGEVAKPLLFVHLSDLHFSSRPADSKWELDQTLRIELGHDLRAEIRKRGGATAFLVSGDIAYSGSRTEYIRARDFLINLCAEVGVPPENVWVVPGNHDIDLKRHAEPETGAARFELMAAAEHKIDSVLERLMSDPSKARPLLAPLANYFDFAADFDCQPASSELTWDAFFEMGDGYMLHILGVNSALVSDKQDKSNCPQLVVGAAQTQLKREKGMIHATVCHHPPTWIRDGSQLKTMFDSNAQLQLTGHEHRFCVSEKEPLRVAAGALHPERDRVDWQPHYNLISMEIVPRKNASDNAYVKICVTSRIWDKTTPRWIANPAKGDSGDVKFQLELDDVATIDLPALNSAGEQYEAPPAEQLVEWLANRRRRLAYRFTRLFVGEQRALAERQGITLGEIAAVEPGALASAVIDRAERKDDLADLSLADLWDAVEHAHSVSDISSNPFREGS
jgi:Calcineurin-like phosphoesterase